MRRAAVKLAIGLLILLAFLGSACAESADDATQPHRPCSRRYSRRLGRRLRRR